jgi:16S rRNA (uracil1498-N3)-methyltransferase
MVWPRKNIFAEYTQPVTARFYVPEARMGERTIELPADEAAHLTRVLRLTSGDHIRIFNGRGDEWDARVDEAHKHRVTATLGAAVAAAAEARVHIVLAPAVLKGDKMDAVVRDAVMLGAAAIQPIVTTRTEVAAGAIARSGRLARWQRIAVASAKQCGRAVVPDVRAVQRFEDVIREPLATVMLVEPGTAAAARSLRELPASERVLVLVGPEGGWTAEEVQQARERGTMLLTLGPHTLRADAVPIVALTALRVHLEDF